MKDVLPPPPPHPPLVLAWMRCLAARGGPCHWLFSSISQPEEEVRVLELSPVPFCTWKFHNWQHPCRRLCQRGKYCFLLLSSLEVILK